MDSRLWVGEWLNADAFCGNLCTGEANRIGTMTLGIRAVIALTLHLYSTIWVTYLPENHFTNDFSLMIQAFDISIFISD